LPTSEPALSTAHFIPWFQDAIVQTLMVPFLVVMGQELAHGTTQGFFAEEEEAHQDFFLHRPHETLDVRRQVG